MRVDRGPSVSSTLRSPTVAGVLDRLHAASRAEDEPAKERIRAREEQLGGRLAQAERYELYGDAPLALPADGHLVTLEADPQYARVASANIAYVGRGSVGFGWPLARVARSVAPLARWAI